MDMFTVCSTGKEIAMNATLNDTSHYADDFEIDVEPAGSLDEALTRPKALDAAVLEVEPPFDLSLAGAGIAVLLFMALFSGFLYSWFTMGS